MPAMRSIIVTILLLNLGTIYTPAVLQDAAQTSAATVAWQWFQNCGSSTKTLGLVVLVDDNAVYQSQFPVCRKNGPTPERKIVFHIKGGHVFRGTYRTSSTQTIEANIWQAGADPDVLLLGVRFASDRVLLNAVHVAKLDSTSVSQLERGVAVRTFPLRSAPTLNTVRPSS